ncbi:MAG: carbamoyltransferase [Acidobacteria bacterium]|nr:carbamoyltransferase [Acidobacteriota bacterium]
MTTSGLNVLGISAFFHDSACCLLRDGEVVAAAEEERFSRRKHDPGLPWRAFRFCLESAGMALSDLDAVAYYEDPVKKLGRQLWMALHPSLPETRRRSLLGRLEVGDVERQLRSDLGWEGPIDRFDHHQSHAASAYYFSGFDDAAILTVDGVGEWATTTFGRGAGADLELLEEVHFPDSVGMLYSTITAYLGFKVNSGEFKVMGLAPYGRPRYVRQMQRLIDPGSRGQFRLALEYFDFIGAERMYSDRLVELFGQPPLRPESEMDQFHKDVARSLQVLLEELLLRKVRYLHERVPSANLCMAGGVALNCVANGRLLREGPFDRLFVQPAASDSGGSLGAAMLSHVQRSGQLPRRRERMAHVYLGPRYGPSEVSELLAASDVEALDFRGDEDALLEAVAERLAAGKVIGWFHGRMEFGPRALGSRSILADPRGPEMRDRINALVKKREAFRPFAPAVLLDRMGEHFELDHPSPFMLETCQVRSPLHLPAITHVDGSARVQTVEARHSPRFAALIERFAQRTGCPILLNTSFNLRGEPIVCTPVDALKTFIRSRIDTLVLEDFVLDRETMPPLWEPFLELEDAPTESAITHEVYTLF